jgi:bifunctional DNA-binding transcriptional regulator/antitoxin component of YhaV-PrlF toxin-antitoxin module
VIIILFIEAKIKIRNGDEKMGIVVAFDNEGRIPIPPSLREEFKLDYLEIEIDKTHKCLVLKPIEDKMARLIGSLSSEKSFLELRKKAEMLALEEVRKKWEREP